MRAKVATNLTYTVEPGVGALGTRAPLKKILAPSAPYPSQSVRCGDLCDLTALL